MSEWKMRIWAWSAASVNKGSLRDYLVVLSDVVVQHQLAVSLGSNLSGSSDHHNYVRIRVMVILEKCVTVLVLL